MDSNLPFLRRTDVLRVIRTSTVLFSVVLHGGLAGTLFLFSNELSTEEAPVYHVSLAEFASPQQPLVPLPNAPATEPEPIAPPELTPPPITKPEILPDSPSSTPKTKKVSPHKQKKTHERVRPERKVPKQPQSISRATPSAQPSHQPASSTSGGSQKEGPVSELVGGILAYKSNQVDQRPSIVKRITPDYPVRARRMSIEGKVAVQAVIDTSGYPKSCTIAFADPKGHFEKSALEAARRMRFIPGMIQGKHVNTVVLIPFIFKLK